MAPLALLGTGVAPAGELAREVIGNKGAGLARLAAAGFPVPPTFALGTDVCRRELGGGAPDLPDLLSRGLRALERATGRVFGAARRPLLVSVRSGAPVSMPGMLATVLDVGLCEATLPGLVRATGNPRMAWDAFRRLVQSYAEAVHGVPPDPFERALEARLESSAVRSERELDAGQLRALTGELLGLFAERVGHAFPQDPAEQLAEAARAVFRSWNDPRAVAYRRHRGIDDALGTAALIQAMVFGNAGGTSGTGVAFTRDPGTGEKELVLDFLLDAQGDDLVTGRRTAHGAGELARVAPGLLAELRQVAEGLERLFRDVQDFEFTVEAGKLYLLQARSAQRTPWAALRIAVDLVREGLVDETAGLRLVEGLDLESISRTRLVHGGLAPVARAVPASPGVAVGRAAFDAASAAARAGAGERAILVRRDASTSDLPGMLAAAGILTERGSRTAHAAVVARQLGKPCLVGCRELRVDAAGGASLGPARLAPGDLLSLDGSSGDVYAGAVEAVVERPAAEIAAARRWAQRGRPG
jgi:pyruvate,orthophosphate dikinase